MIFVEWKENKHSTYRVIVALEDKRGSLAKFLDTLVKFDCNVIGLSYNGFKGNFTTTCEIVFETHINNTNELRKQLSKHYKIIELFSLKDAYNK